MLGPFIISLNVGISRVMSRVRTEVQKQGVIQAVDQNQRIIEKGEQ